jgi:hypothetical protein
MKPHQDVSGIELELTNTITTVSGSVHNDRGERVKDYTVVVFSQDKDRWTNPRHQGVGRPDQDGRFKVSGLPAGEYFVVAVDRLEPGESSDAEFLDRIQIPATRFSVGEGETKTFDLKLAPGS